MNFNGLLLATILLILSMDEYVKTAPAHKREKRQAFGTTCAFYRHKSCGKKRDQNDHHHGDGVETRSSNINGIDADDIDTFLNRIVEEETQNEIRSSNVDSSETLGEYPDDIPRGINSDKRESNLEGSFVRRTDRQSTSNHFDVLSREESSKKSSTPNGDQLAKRIISLYKDLKLLSLIPSEK